MILNCDVAVILYTTVVSDVLQYSMYHNNDQDV